MNTAKQHLATARKNLILEARVVRTTTLRKLNCSSAVQLKCYQKRATDQGILASYSGPSSNIAFIKNIFEHVLTKHCWWTHLSLIDDTTCFSLRTSSVESLANTADHLNLHPLSDRRLGLRSKLLGNESMSSQFQFDVVPKYVTLNKSLHSFSLVRCLRENK